MGVGQTRTSSIGICTLRANTCFHTQDPGQPESMKKVGDLKMENYLNPPKYVERPKFCLIEIGSVPKLTQIYVMEH